MAEVGPPDLVTPCPQCGEAGPACVLRLGERVLVLPRPHLARRLLVPSGGPHEAVAVDPEVAAVVAAYELRRTLVGPSDDPTTVSVVGPSDDPIVESLEDGSPDGLISDLLAFRPTEHAP